MIQVFLCICSTFWLIKVLDCIVWLTAVADSSCLIIAKHAAMSFFFPIEYAKYHEHLEKIFRTFLNQKILWGNFWPFSPSIFLSVCSLFNVTSWFHQLHLLEGGLHADINGDGVLDHVQVTYNFWCRSSFSMSNWSDRFYLRCANMTMFVRHRLEVTFFFFRVKWKLYCLNINYQIYQSNLD